MKCEAFGSPQVSYIWLKDDRKLSGNKTLLVDKLQNKDEGLYECVVSNGLIEKRSRLHVKLQCMYCFYAEAHLKSSQKLHPSETKKYLVLLTVCSYHVTYAFQTESTLHSCLNVKELLARSRREIWSLIDCNWTRNHNHLVHKRTLNNLAKLARWVSVCLWTKCCGFKSSYSHLVLFPETQKYWDSNQQG